MFLKEILPEALCFLNMQAEIFLTPLSSIQSTVAQGPAVWFDADGSWPWTSPQCRNFYFGGCSGLWFSSVLPGSSICLLWTRPGRLDLLICAAEELFVTFNFPYFLSRPVWIFGNNSVQPQFRSSFVSFSCFYEWVETNRGATTLWK